MLIPIKPIAELPITTCHWAFKVVHNDTPNRMALKLQLGTTLLAQTRRHGAGNAPKSAEEDPPSGASFIPHFRRREIGAQSAPEISDFPAPSPSCGRFGAGDYLYVRTDHFSGAVLGTFRRRRLPVCAD